MEYFFSKFIQFPTQLKKNGIFQKSDKLFFEFPKSRKTLNVHKSVNKSTKNVKNLKFFSVFAYKLFLITLVYLRG